MKKVLRILGLGAVLATSSTFLAGCGEDDADLVIGMVCIGDPATSTYDANFYNGLEDTKAYFAEQGFKIKTKYERKRGEKEEAKAAAEELAEECDIVLLNSYGHQEFGYQVAQNFPDVKFVSCTGDTAAAKQIPNFYNAFANIYEGRYLAGIAAGMKLNTIGNDASDHVLGYVAAWPYAEVISGYTAFYLGAKSVCPDVTMKTVVTKSWGDEGREGTGANKLIAAGCKIISQHADSYGAPRECQKNGVPNVSYNVEANSGTLAQTYLCSSRINWTPYFNYLVDCLRSGETIAYDWTGGIKDGSVVVGSLGNCAAAGTQEAIDAAAAKIKNGTLEVFDCSKFTVSKSNNPFADVTLDGGDSGHVVACKANVVPDASYAPDTDVVENGIFKESVKRSAPYFELNIDGITCIDEGAAYND